MNIKKLTDLRMLQKNSLYTITGVGGDLEEWVNGYNEKLKKEKIGTPKQLYTFKGRDVNDEFDLSGNNRFKDDLTFLAFVLDGLNIGKLAMFKLKWGDRWSDDIIANSIDENHNYKKLKNLESMLKIKNRNQLRKIISESKYFNMQEIRDELKSSFRDWELQDNLTEEDAKEITTSVMYKLKLTQKDYKKVLSVVKQYYGI